MKIHKIKMLFGVVVLSVAMNSFADDDNDHDDDDDGEESEITLIHIGDIHGQIEPAFDVRSDNKTQMMAGGLSRMYTLVKKIRKKADRDDRTHFTFMTGDTTHGSVEATFSRGEDVLNVLNKFDIDLFAPGNWDFTYGTCRTNELWGFTDTARAILNGNARIKNSSDGSAPPYHSQKCDFVGSKSTVASWQTIAANAYIDNDRNSANCPPAADRTRLFDASKIITDKKTGIKIGLIGFTTERGPRVIGNPVVEGICFTKGDEEIVELVSLMNEKRANGEVDVVVMISELNLANNRRVLDLVDAELGAGGVDLVLSADMHEKTPKMLYTAGGTPMIAQSMDGYTIGEIKLEFDNKKLKKVKFTPYMVDEKVRKNSEIADMIEEIREPLINGTQDGKHFVHGRTLPKDIDDPNNKYFDVAQPLAVAGVDLNRSNFTHEESGGVYQGSIHSMFTDALRTTGKDLIDAKMANGDMDAGGSFADLCASHDASGACEKSYPVMGLIRGFRYGTSVRKGEAITLDTLYHVAPIGPLASIGVVTGETLLGRGAANNKAVTANGLEHAAHLSLGPDVRQWGGGWLQTYSGMTYSLNPYAAKDKRIPTDQVLIGNDEEGYTPVDPAGKYIIVGYGFNDVVFGTDSGANEYVFVNKPFKMHKAGVSKIWRIVFDNESHSTLDTVNNKLDLAAVTFSANGSNPAINSLPVVDLVARYLMTNFADKDEDFELISPAKRVNVLCAQPDMADVRRTRRSQVLDADNPIVDVGFSMIQSIFGANKNLLPFLEDDQLEECEENGIIEVKRDKINYIGD